MSYYQEDLPPVPPPDTLTGDSTPVGADHLSESKDVFLVEFEGPNDLDNPKNWPLSKKLRTVFLVSMLTVNLTFASSVSSAAIEYVKDDFKVGHATSNLQTAVFLFGFAFGALPLAPLSELYGRAPVYSATLLISSLFELGGALAPNIQTLIITRFFAGFFGATPLSNAGGSIADMCTPSLRTLIFPIFASCGFLGPLLGPVIGGWICQEAGWKWAYWVTFFWGMAVLVLVVLFAPETLADAILRKKAKALRKATGDSRYHAAAEFSEDQTVAMFKTAMSRPFVFMVREPIIIFMTLYISVAYIVLFGDFEAYPLIFSVYNFNTGEVGLAFIPIIVGVFLCCATTPLVYWHENRTRQRLGTDIVPPETRLVQLMPTSLMMPIALFWLAWTCYSSVSYWSPLMSGVPLGFGFLFVFIAVYQYCIDSYGKNASSALAVLTFVRYNASGGWVLATTPLFTHIGNHWGASFLACKFPTFSRFYAELTIPLSYLSQ
ncbi:hypothetical protein G7K_5403-t1 [Saitoella complicata NRRL Y-17804]|uniref:Major facilitator superfamily (MFS) profile domain-containing protein n=1 Tax=Saitoella complicata (strain BCRC 22490 / CBS 7301 / JCM 7358 / NBRC 10748 / NRRL Y-17804) TaxID=698492 RepID=A0A0E9NNA8_SAICN|nr:hypothetical protein G7K_5403-t1 [Saitoella complicata NRRL Y-17804]